MVEVEFISNKTKKEIAKITFALTLATLSWLIQVSILSRFSYFDITLNLFLLGTVFCTLRFGITAGVIFGACASFFSSSILYDHIFYISYPLIGLITGVITKSVFSDELLYYAILCFLLTFITEFLNGWQFSIINQTVFIPRYLQISISSGIIHLLISPIYYILIKFVTNKLNIR